MLRNRFLKGRATAAVSRLKESWWKARHEEKLKQAKAGNPRWVLLGDSITQGWEDLGREAWARHLPDVEMLNLGFMGDRTEHLLWRLQNGEVDNIDPELFVLLIGTNNTAYRQDSARTTAKAISLIIKLLRTHKPGARVLLIGILPRGSSLEEPFRAINEAINMRIAEFADGARLHYVDVGKTFMNADGSVDTKLMPDALHLSAEGYLAFADVLRRSIPQQLIAP